jgi:hypothetical protein
MWLKKAAFEDTLNPKYPSVQKITTRPSTVEDGIQAPPGNKRYSLKLKEFQAN